MKKEFTIHTTEGLMRIKADVAETPATAFYQGYVVQRPTDPEEEYRRKGKGVPNAIRRAVYKRDGFRCALCDDTRGLQIHHVIKRSLGGSDRPENLITLCWRCHAVAHGQRFQEYPPHIDADWMEQACVEYVSDWWATYHPEDPGWYPYK